MKGQVKKVVDAGALALITVPDKDPVPHSRYRFWIHDTFLVVNLFLHLILFICHAQEKIRK